MKSWLRKSNRANFSFVPNMKISGLQRQFACTCGLLVHIEQYSGIVVGIQCINFIRTCYFYIYRVVEPLVILCPSYIELIDFRNIVILFVIKIGKVFCIRDINVFILAEFPFIRSGMRALMTRIYIQSATTTIFRFEIMIGYSFPTQII